MEEQNPQRLGIGERFFFVSRILDVKTPAARKYLEGPPRLRMSWRNASM